MTTPRQKVVSARVPASFCLSRPIIMLHGQSTAWEVATVERNALLAVASKPGRIQRNRVFLKSEREKEVRVREEERKGWEVDQV